MKRPKRSDRLRLRTALLTSLLVHGGAVALVWSVARGAEAPPKMRVYAVDIVSPPPQLAGDFNPGGPAEPEVVEEVPEAEPVPPTPEPEPPPPTPAPPPPKQAPAPPRKEPSPPPKATKPEAEKPPAKPPAKAPAQKAKPAPSSAESGSGASRGARPDPASAGGEGLDVQLKGVQCPSPAYCGNIVRQLNRYFRPPAGASNDVAEIFFQINRDGSVSDIRVVRSSGSVSFRVAAMEAVEQAGMNKAFGALPGAFERDRLPVSFSFRPAR